MTQEQKQQLKQTVLVEIDDTQYRIEDLKELTQPVSPDSSIGRLTRMDAIGSKSVNEEALRIAQNRLNKLEYTLAQIDKSEFGACQSCGSVIPFQRLLYIPESNLCVKCSK